MTTHVHNTYRAVDPILGLLLHPFVFAKWWSFRKACGLFGEAVLKCGSAFVSGGWFSEVLPFRSL